MRIKKHLSYLLVTSALALPMPMGAWAQSIQINENQLAEKSQPCQTLGQLVQERDRPFTDEVTQRIVDAINADRAENCATIAQRLRTDPDGTMTLQAMEQTTERLTERTTERATAEVTKEVELSEQVEIEGDARVAVPEPEVDVEVPAPDVRVTTRHPQVDVTDEAMRIELQQAQPEIEVEVPQLTVRVHIPAPKLYVLQAEPQVRVSQNDPQVEVSQGDPVVRVTQGQPRLDVDIDLDENAQDRQARLDGEEMTGDADRQAKDSQQVQDGKPMQANRQASDTRASRDGQRVDGNVRISAGDPQVEIVDPDGQPRMTYQRGEANLSYESAEPRISVVMADQAKVEVTRGGEPTVVMETTEEREQRRQARAGDTDTQRQRQAAAGTMPETNGAAMNGSRMSVANLMNYEVVTSDGEDLGAPEAFVEIDGRTHLVLSDGGFLGIGEKQVPVPMSRVVVRDDQLVLSNLTEDEIEAANDYDYDGNRVLPRDRAVSIGR